MSRRAIGLAVLFYVISCSLLAFATVCRCRPSRWIGLVDAAIAFALVIAAGVLWTRWRHVPHQQRRHEGYDAVTLIAPAIFIGLWLGRDAIDWNVLLPGLAWRSWLLLHSLPTAIASWRGLGIEADFEDRHVPPLNRRTSR